MFGSTPAFGAASGGSFSFGTTKPAFGTSTPAFGSSTPAFGANTPAFSASSTPAFGATSTPAFGASSTPAFGAAPAFGASAGGFGFGASTSASSSAFSFPSSSTPAFGAASQPAFGQTPGFGSSAPAFGGASAAAPGQIVPFAVSSTQQPQQPQGQQHQLFAKNGQPITDSTQWDDIHEDSQRNLLQLEQVIVQCRQQRQHLNAGEHLQQSKQVKQDMEAHHQVLLHTLQVVGRVIKADSDSVRSFSERVAQLLRDTDTAVTTFTRTKLWRELTQLIQYKLKSGVLQSHAQGQPIEPAKRDMVLRLPIVLPSKFLTSAVQQFKETVQQYQELVQRLETVIQSATGMEGLSQSKKNGADDPPLQIIMQNVCRYLMAVAANLDCLHEAVADARQTFLAKRQEEGDFSNPFADADRLEQQKRKAEQQSQLAHAALTAAPAQPQQQGQVQPAPASAPQLGFGQSAPASSAAGSLFGSMPAFGQQSAAATGGLFGSSQAAFGTPQPAPTTSNTFGASSGGLFGTPQSSPAMFGTPSSSAFGAPAQSSGGFGQTPLFGAATPTVFGKPSQTSTNKKSSKRR